MRLHICHNPPGDSGKALVAAGICLSDAASLAGGRKEPSPCPTMPLRKVRASARVYGAQWMAPGRRHAIAQKLHGAAVSIVAATATGTAAGTARWQSANFHFPLRGTKFHCM